jgi:hypothetical protein
MVNVLDYLPAVASCEEMSVKVDFSCEPSVLTTVNMATETPAAVSPYSIAVAPEVIAKTPNQIFDSVLLVVCVRFPAVPFPSPGRLNYQLFRQRALLPS